MTTTYGPSPGAIEVVDPVLDESPMSAIDVSEIRSPLNADSVIRAVAH